ncbi:MAG: TIGR03809 family protein [Proteobacteria bacterium]|nr:TIGR03809 family protein [Pseudomonadota bacterium]
MAQRYGAAYAQDILARWCLIAEQRLDHLTELYETGRWRRYHSESAFLENLQEAKAAVETWRVLAHREATPDNIAVDWSWLGRRTPPAEQASLMQGEKEESQAGILGTEAVHAALTSIRNPQEAGNLDCEAAEDAASGAGITSESEFIDERKSGSRAVQERHPVLHNAL